MYKGRSRSAALARWSLPDIPSAGHAHSTSRCARKKSGVRPCPSIPFYLNEHIIQECKKLGIVGAKLETMNEIYLDDVHPFYIPPSADASRNRPTPYLDALDESSKEELFTLYKRLEKGWRRGKWDSLALYEHITNAVYAPLCWLHKISAEKIESFPLQFPGLLTTDIHTE